MEGGGEMWGRRGTNVEGKKGGGKAKGRRREGGVRLASRWLENQLNF